MPAPYFLDCANMLGYGGGWGLRQKIRIGEDYNHLILIGDYLRLSYTSVTVKNLKVGGSHEAKENVTRRIAE